MIFLENEPDLLVTDIGQFFFLCLFDLHTVKVIGSLV